MKTTSRRSHRARPPVPSLLKPFVEYPQEGELLPGESYTMRIDAPGARLVRVAVDQGPWLDARLSVGYWWFDWSGIESGPHEVIACAEYEGGREAVSEVKHCRRP